MSFNILPTPGFSHELKRLSRKYISIKNDLSQLLISLAKEPALGQPLGNNCYKIRMAISSKNKGKSGGARVITCVKIVDEVIYLVSIYDKSEAGTITNDELLSRIKNL